MTTRIAGEFTPRSGSAPFVDRVRSQSLMEAKLMLRNGEQLLLAIVIPLLTLGVGIYAVDRLDLDSSQAAVDLLTPGVLALAIMSTSFTSLAIATGFERRSGLLRRLAVSPLSRSGLLIGKVGALLAVEGVQATLIGIVALLLGWSPSLAGIPIAIFVAILGTLAFAGLGLSLAGTLRAEATLAVANLVNLLLMFGGAIVVPRSEYGAAGEWVQFLPSAALGDAMRTALIDGGFDWQPIGILVVWAVIGAAAAARWFRWD
jgi:ABC-2 type transport system permease protein